MEALPVVELLSVLLKIVVEAKAISSNFLDILTRLESTLKAIIPRCVEINRLNNELDISQQGMKELEVIISDGEALVLECSKIYSINLFKMKKYSNKLSNLETTLLRYFTTILPLDHFKDTKEILVVLKRLELKLVGDEDKGGVLNRGELSGKPKVDFGRSGVQETPELYNNADYEKESLKELVSVNDGKICNGSESEKPKEDLYRNSKKKEHFVGDHFVGICKIRKAQFSKNLPCELGKPKEDSVYQRKPMKKLFLLKGYAYDIDLEDLERPFNLVSKGTNVTSYRSNAQLRDVFVKTINLEVQVKESEFKQRMEDIGKVGQHPNIMLPFGYLFSETARYLLYDYAPASSLYALSKETQSLGTRPHWDRSLKIILGAARGISHIHSQGGIIHGNIKSSNVLVTADYDGLISDFGLAPMMNIPALTPELSAPELKETGKATQKSDVYNFGVMLFEIVNQYSKLWLYGWFVGLEQVAIRKIIGKCKDTDPDRRPKMDEVVKLIQQVQSEPSDNKQQSLLKTECDKLAENPKEDSTSDIKQATKMLHDDSEKEVHMKLLDVDEGICDQNESGKTMKVSGSEIEYDMELVQGPKKKEFKWYQPFRKEDEPTKLNPKYVQIKPSGTKLFLLKGCLHHNLDLQDLQWSEADSLGNGICRTTYRCNTKYGEFRIKRLTEVNVGEKEFKQRVEELGKVGQHSNIMPPFGYYFSEFEKFLVYDYSPEGSLSALLHENKGSGRSPLDWSSRVKIALGTAKGIAHLHSKGGGVKLLGSIKSSNILLTSDFDGCISDYGLTPIMNFFTTSSQESGDHALEIPLISSQKSDVYSFGLLLLEILTGQKPALVDLPRWIITKIWEEKSLNVLFDMELLEFQHFEDEMKQMLHIAMQCVEMNPDKRPKMDGVVKLVEKIRPSH